MVEDGLLPSRLLSAVSQQAQELGVHNSPRREEAALAKLGVRRAGARRASEQPTAVQEGSPLTEIILSHGAKPTGLSGQVQKMRGMQWSGGCGRWQVRGLSNISLTLFEEGLGTSLPPTSGLSFGSSPFSLGLSFFIHYVGTATLIQTVAVRSRALN